MNTDYIVNKRKVGRGGAWVLLGSFASACTLAFALLDSTTAPASAEPAELSEIQLAANHKFARPSTETIALAAPSTQLATFHPGPSLPDDADTAVITALPAEEQPTWVTLDVKPGDALSTLFERHDIGASIWLPLSKIGGDAKRLNWLRPGDTLQLLQESDGSYSELRMRVSPSETLVAKREPDGWTAGIEVDELEHRRRFASAQIHSSLFLAGQAAGISDRLTMELAAIYAWDIDFALDIREGDSFTIVYEDVYRDGEFIQEGDIVAAEFTNHGRTIRALRYVDSNGRAGYFTPEGRPMRKAFIRTPVEFTRISSRFSSGRNHPILNRIRAHKGVDYAAPRGTPVKAAGDGRVILAGRKGGYGNAIVLQHGGGIYSTLYGHLDHFARGIHNGSSVKQGQIIGYVGSTGLATGPHLHYEFRKNGVHVDPLTVRLPSASPVPKSERKHFEAVVTPLVAELDDVRDQLLAQAPTTPAAPTGPAAP